MNIIIYTYPMAHEPVDQRLPPSLSEDNEGFALEPHTDGTCTVWEWDHLKQEWGIDWFSFFNTAKAIDWLRKYTRKDNVVWVHLDK